MRMHTASRGPSIAWTAIALAVLSVAGFIAPAGASPDIVPAGAAPELATSDPGPAAGYFRLSWAGAGAVELEEATRPDFGDARVIYRGTDTSRAMSGKPDGDWYYRVRPADGASADWSEPLQVEVQHHPLARALFFFVVGAGVFLATALLVFGGGRRDSPGDGGG